MNKKSGWGFAISEGIIVYALCVLPAVSAEVRPVPLTLDGAIKFAAANRIEMRIEEARISEMQAKVEQAKGAFLPSLDLSIISKRVLNYDQFSGVTINGTVGGQPINVQVSNTVPRYTISPSLALNYDLYTGGQNEAKLKQAHADLDVAVAERSIGLRKIVKSVANTYWKFREAQVYYDDATRAVQLAEKAARIAQVRVTQGKLSELDYKSEVINAAEKKIDADQTMVKLSDSFYAYLDAIGLSADESTYDLRQVPELRTAPDDAVPYLEQISEQHPEEGKGIALVQVARMEVKSAEADNRPKLSLFVQYRGVGRDDGAWSGAADNLARQDFSIGLQLKANLFDGFKTTNRIVEVESAENRAQLELAKTHLVLKQVKRDSLSHLRKAEDGLKITQERLTLAQMKLNISKTKHMNGHESDLAFQQAQLEVQSSQDKVLIAKIEVAIARVNFILAVPD